MSQEKEKLGSTTLVKVCTVLGKTCQLWEVADHWFRVTLPTVPITIGCNGVLFQGSRLIYHLPMFSLYRCLVSISRLICPKQNSIPHFSLKKILLSPSLSHFPKWLHYHPNCSSSKFRNYPFCLSLSSPPHLTHQHIQSILYHTQLWSLPLVTAPPQPKPLKTHRLLSGDLCSLLPIQTHLPRWEWSSKNINLIVWLPSFLLNAYCPSWTETQAPAAFSLVLCHTAFACHALAILALSESL